MQQIAPNLFTFTGLLVGRVYLIVDGTDLTLIDGGIPPAGPRILKQLRAAGLDPAGIKNILLTHAHPDHVGGFAEIQKHCDAPILCSALEAEVLAGKYPIPQPDRSSFSGLSKYIGPPATTLANMKAGRIIEDGELLAGILGGLQAIASPGHAPGHLSYWQPERKILFCGDTIFNLTGLSKPWRMVTVDMAQNNQSIKRLAALEPEIICFGHGKPVLDNAAARLRSFAQSL